MSEEMLLIVLICNFWRYNVWQHLFTQYQLKHIINLSGTIFRYILNILRNRAYAKGPVSREQLQIQTWFQWTSNRKWRIEISMVTWLMTSRDPERSRSWTRYICERLEIRTWCQWITHRRLLPGNQMVTWPMTSRDRERPRSWPKYAYGPVSRKQLEIQSYRLGFNGPPIENSLDRWLWIILNCYQFEFLRESRGISQISEATMAERINIEPATAL